LPCRDPANWDAITYKYDPSGRRIKKTIDGYPTTYLYDGDDLIAEYDGNNNLVRKYVYGPRIDEPVCMIDLADSNAVYYYHFDGLGSVVALTDSNGTCVQTYEYSVYGHVAASDPNHPNPFMFTGRQFDIETGLYYYRARYYNPYLGRFLQTDPVGYEDGINWYRYCRNNPLVYTDPSGLCVDPCDPCDTSDDPCLPDPRDYWGTDVWLDWIPNTPYFEWTGGWEVRIERANQACRTFLAGNISIGTKRINYALKGVGAIKTAFEVAAWVLKDRIPNPASPVDVALQLVSGFNEVINIYAESINNIEASLDYGFRAYICVQQYEEYEEWPGIIGSVIKWFRGRWKSSWPEVKGLKKGWVEVKGGEGWDTGGVDKDFPGWGYYSTKWAAIEAVREAITNLMRPRPTW